MQSADTPHTPLKGAERGKIDIMDMLLIDPAMHCPCAYNVRVDNNVRVDDHHKSPIGNYDTTRYGIDYFPMNLGTGFTTMRTGDW